MALWLQEAKLEQKAERSGQRSLQLSRVDMAVMMEVTRR